MQPRSRTPDRVLISDDGVVTSSFGASEAARQKLYRRTLIVVVVSQVFGGAGLAAGVAVGALLAQQMLGTDSLTGAPVALFTLGSAGSALVVGRLSQRFGRRLGLFAGYTAGSAGAAGVVLAAVANSVPVLFLSLLIYGAGTATNLQARYAGTDLAAPTRRATAVSVVLVSTTLGAVAGPNLIGVMGDVALAWSIPPLAGPFLLASVVYLLAGIVLFILLRPDPLLVARAFSMGEPQSSAAPSGAHSTRIIQHGVAVGAVVMVLTTIAMVAIMTMTPIHMQNHGQDLAATGFVIGIHIAAMYLPSLITGVLVDKLGRTPMVIAAGVTLLAAGLVAALAPADSIAGLTVALALLGLGWNFGLITGTALVADAAPLATRARTQGSVDLLVALAGASGGAASGVVVAASGFSVLALAGGVLSLVLIPIVVWSRPRSAAGTAATIS